MDYAFITDVSSDLTPELASEAHVDVMPMEFRMDSKSYLHYLDGRMMSFEEFYSKQKSGIFAKTTQINYNSFISCFEQYLKAGKDVLYTGIASGISGTFNTSLMAVKDLQEKYPERKIISIDSTCDSVGLGYLIYLSG
ncbi:MAG: DegV family protein, partial [Clostridiales bacterium]|nr:DegV family protein [Clostridiales bacterium]